MSKEYKLTEEELSSIDGITDEFNEVIAHLGHIDIQVLELNDSIKILEGQKTEFIQKYRNIREHESELTKKLVEKYGTGKIDRERGIFISNNSD